MARAAPPSGRLPDSTRQWGPAAISIFGARLTRRGWWFVGLSLVAFFAAYMGGRAELLYVACLLFALPLVAVIVVRARRPRLAVTRAFAPHIIQAGTTTAVTLAVRNTAPSRTIRALWWDRVPWHPGFTLESELPSLEPRGPRYRRNITSVGYDLRPPRRGVFPIGPLHVQVVDAFGLATASADVGEQQPIIVTPEVIPLADTGLSIPAGDGESRLVQRRATGDEDDVMTREYRQGDAMRRVHWRASARHGDLMVRQEEQRSFPEARIIVDTCRAGYRDLSSDDLDDVAESDAFEWVVRMLASVAVHLRRTGFLVTIDETGPAQLDSIGRGRRRTWGDEEFLGKLASLELTSAEGNHAGRERGSNGPIFALVGTPEPETVDWMLAQRRPGELAVAFMVRNTSALDVIDRSFGVPTAAPAIAQRFADAGWLVVPVRSHDDHAAAWEAVVVETGRARGTA